MIYTITLNPAFDVHADADRFEAFHEKLARLESRQAGFAAAAASGAAERLQLAVACGTAACLTEGSLLPRKADIDRVFEEIEIVKL